MKDYDYCIIRVPNTSKSFALLQHFSLLYSLDGKETLWTVENTILRRNELQAYVLLSNLAIVGIAILEPPEQIDFIRAKFNIDSHRVHRYHTRNQEYNSGFATLKTAMNHKLNSMASVMVPLLPRQTESNNDCQVPEDTSTYLFFSNVTLISPQGLPYVRNCKPLAEKMLMRYHSNSDRYLKSLPYTYYVNVVQSNLTEINKKAKYIELSSGGKYYYDKLFLLCVYGSRLRTYCCIATLLEMNVPASSIVFIESFPSIDEKKARVSPFANVYVDKTMREVLDNMKINVYSSYHFKSWEVDMDNMVTHVEFIAHFNYVKIQCAAFFYYGRKDVNEQAYIEPTIPTYTRLVPSRGITDGISLKPNATSTMMHMKLVLRNFTEIETGVPDFKKPIVRNCTLPGGLQYLEVRSPGMKVPHHYLQSLTYNGFVMETFKEGYFKLHLTNDLIVDGITCLTPAKYSLENIPKLYGLSSSALNNVHLRYTGSATGETLKEGLRRIADKIVYPKSPHVEAITKYVIQWVAENDILLPMYLQPWQKAEYAYDLESNPAFKRKKKNITK
ncbi:unnamed protein product, partial [Leptidea sinapis]